MKSLIPLKEEFDLVYSYLEIEKARFKERLNVMFNLDEMDFLYTPPLAIQTLIENAVRHGILAKPEGGSLYINLKRYKNYALLTIKDNGVGIPEEKIGKLFNIKNKEAGGIGIYNANTRLKRQFGEGLKVESELNHGTTITVYLPYKYNENIYEGKNI